MSCSTKNDDWHTEFGAKVESVQGLNENLLGFPGGPSGKEPPANARDVRDTGWIPGLGSSPGAGHSNPLEYSYLENPMDRRTWQATVHGNTKSWTQLK